MTPIIIFLSLLLSLNSYSNEKIVENQISQIQTGLDGIQNEVVLIQSYIEQTVEREKKIYDFRIRFSDLITKFATDSTDTAQDIQFKKNKTELELLEIDVYSWLEEAANKKEKVSDLLIILTETVKSYQDKVSISQGSTKKSYNSFYQFGKKNILSLSDLESKIDAHITFLKEFEIDTAKWKDFFLRKIRKGLNRNFFKWEINTIFDSPAETITGLRNDFEKITDEITGINLTLFVAENKGKILIRFFLAIILFVVILFSFSKTKLWLQKIPNDILDKNVSDILNILANNKMIFAFFSFFILFLNRLGNLTFDNYPNIIGLVYTTLMISILWQKFASPVIVLFLEEINKSKNQIKKITFSSLPVLVFILTRSLQHFFNLESDILHFFNSFLLAWVSYKIFILSLKFKIESVRFGVENLAIFLRSAKIFMSFFSGAILISSFLEIIGLANIGKSIQSVVISNVVILGLGWLMYQFVNYLLKLKRKKLKVGKKFKKNMELLDFLGNILNVSFFIIFSLIFLESWHSAIFVFADFWSITLFKIGDYSFTIDRPIKLIIAYYVIRSIQIGLLYSLDSYFLKKMNIEKKHSANIASIIRYFFIVIFLSVCSTILGMTYKNLVIFASALGVGIGFGLQNIVNNFISGIILLFEQPIRVGDIIEVNSLFSKVKHIGIRSTIVESFDNSSIIIPNSEILSNKLINWTLNDNIIALKCEVGVAYGSDTKNISRILSEVASENPNVLDSPVPLVCFSAFGDSSLNFSLKIWIDQVEDKLRVHSDIMHAINIKFHENNVTIPFPQRDLHIFEAKN